MSCVIKMCHSFKKIVWFTPITNANLREFGYEEMDLTSKLMKFNGKFSEFLKFWKKFPNEQNLPSSSERKKL